MKIETLHMLIYKSLKELTKKDFSLFKNRVKEEAINHRFAIYFEQNFLKIVNENIYHFDLEYNKNYFDEKEIINENDLRIKFRPDFLVHQRFSNKHNLVAFELKKGYPNKKDRRTINGILEKPFSYLYGVIISYFPSKDRIKIEIHQKNKLSIEKEIIVLSKNDLANE